MPKSSHLDLNEEQLLAILQEMKTFEGEGDDALELLIQLVCVIRPPRRFHADFSAERLQRITYFLDNDTLLASRFKQMLLGLFQEISVRETFSDSGIDSALPGWVGLVRRIKHKILPPLAETNSLSFFIQSLFFETNDYRWVSGISDKEWARFFVHAHIRIDTTQGRFAAELREALYILSYRTVSIGIDPDISDRHGKKSLALNPFVQQNKILTGSDPRFARPEQGDIGERVFPESFFVHFREALIACQKSLTLMHRKNSALGVSLRQTHAMVRLDQILRRMLMIVNLLEGKDPLNPVKTVQLFKQLVETENSRTGIRKYLNENLQLVAFQITEHVRSTGEKYITTQWVDYVKMYISAAWGGVIISFICLLKVLSHHIRMAPFWEAMAHSINYSIGFLAIQSTGATLATKQPAMTAASVAASMDSQKFGGPNLPALAITISQVWRSQTASFIGNLALVFPLSLLFAYLCDLLGFKVAEGEYAQHLLDMQNPTKSLTILYASITGFFLFLSGIISGYVDNRTLSSKIVQRLVSHATLKVMMGKKNLTALATFVKKNMGWVAGNISLGFFLGFAKFFGDIFGLPFDIRHITISMGSFSFGLYGINFDLPLSEFLWVFGGILGIGFINFLVSFALALLVAMKSRKVNTTQFKPLFGYLWRLLKKYPADFLLPPREPRTVKDFV